MWPLFLALFILLIFVFGWIVQCACGCGICDWFLSSTQSIVKTSQTAVGMVIRTARVLFIISLCGFILFYCYLVCQVQYNKAFTCPQCPPCIDVGHLYSFEEL